VSIQCFIHGNKIPEPIIEFNFESGFKNTGSVGNSAKVNIYTEGEGPYLNSGPWGFCLDTQ